jgi:arsenate reductase
VLNSKYKVLFLCTGNPARSQMAEGFFRAMAGETFVPMSVGVEPEPPDPLAAKVMGQIGIDISGQRSYNVERVLKDHFAYVVGIGDRNRERCPIFPFTYYLLQWSFEDPAACKGSEEKRLPVFQRARGIMEQKVRELVSRTHCDLAERLGANQFRKVA